jgi:hypothetical protein
MATGEERAWMVLRQPDHEAFSEFASARSVSLFRTTYLVVGDYQLAQDLVQESLVKTYLAWPRPARPMTHAVGQTIHHGDQVVQTGKPVAAVDVVDAGVVYLTQDGELWFTDGSGRRQIDAGTGSYNEGYEARPSPLGSGIAWVRHERGLPVEVVGYDADTERFVLRQPAGPLVWPEHDPRSPYAQVAMLTPDVVVVTYSDTNYAPGRTAGQIRYVSYGLATGRSTELSANEFEQLQLASPAPSRTWRTPSTRSLVTGSAFRYLHRCAMAPTYGCSSGSTTGPSHSSPMDRSCMKSARSWSAQLPNSGVRSPPPGPPTSYCWARRHENVSGPRLALRGRLQRMPSLRLQCLTNGRQEPFGRRRRLRPSAG